MCRLLTKKWDKRNYKTIQAIAKSQDGFHVYFCVSANIFIDLSIWLTYTVINRYILTLILWLLRLI